MTELKTKEELRSEFEDIRTRMDEIPEAICNCLKNFQIYPNINGYAYLKTAIEICIDNPSYIGMVTKRVYPAVATKYNVTVAGVESVMRTAIKGRLPKASKEFRDKFFMDREDVTVSEFLAIIVEFLKEYDGTITLILHQLGISANFKGYNYLKKSIMLALESPNDSLKSIYSTVASEYGATIQQVERNIRYAIEISNSRSDHDFYLEIFEEEKSRRPTNSEYIFAVANYIKLKK